MTRHRRLSHAGFSVLLMLWGCSSDISDVPRSTGGAAQAATPRAGNGGKGTLATTPPTVSRPPATTAGNGAPTTCAEGFARVTLVTPTVWLVIDGSSSMTTEFAGGVDRWQTLRSTLMGPMGVVPSLQHNVSFGMVIYSGGDESKQCVNLVTSPPALDNFATLDAAYPSSPLGRGTPTDKALEHVFTQLPVLNVASPDANDGPIYVVLATDGAPNDMCSMGGGAIDGDAVVEQRVVDVATRATAMGAKLFVVSLAGSDTRLQTHLEAVAAVTESKHPPFVPATQAELIAALRMIVGGGTCQLKLNGSVAAGQECQGQVLLNGTAVACGAANGWQLSDSSTLQLTGTACDSFLAQQSTLQASFPCGVFVPQ